MARQDICMDTDCGEITTSGNLNSKIFLPFKFLGSIESLGDDACVYGEITVPLSFVFSDGVTVCVKIPYIAAYKKLMVRFRIDNYTDDMIEHVINRTNNHVWFQVGNVKASEFVDFDNQFNFCLVCNNWALDIFSAKDTDLILSESLQQNKVFMLKCFPGNMYRHPTTGVGLVDYICGNIEGSDLATKIQTEFANDKVTVNNASITDDGVLYLDIIESNG